MLPVASNPGFYTGTFVFLPLVALAIVISIRGGYMGVKGVVVFLASGIIGHALLGAAYGISAVAGPAAVLAFDVLAFDVLAGLSPALVALLLCKVFRIGVPKTTA